MRQPDHFQALQEVGSCCLGGPGVCSCPSLRLLCGAVWDPELQLRYFCLLWAGAPGQQGLLSVTGKGWRGKRLLCSPRGCLNGNEELKTFLRSSMWCLLPALSEYECLFFTELQGDSEVFMQLRCWDHEAVVMSSVKMC